MEKKDRIRHLEQMGLDLYQSWLGLVSQGRSVLGMQAIQREMLPASKGLLQDLIQMRHGWMRIVEDARGLFDPGMPWHWMGMGEHDYEGESGNGQFGGAKRRALREHSFNPPDSRSGNAFSSLLPPRTRSQHFSQNGNGGPQNGNPGLASSPHFEGDAGNSGLKRPIRGEFEENQPVPPYQDSLSKTSPSLDEPENRDGTRQDFVSRSDEKSARNQPSGQESNDLRKTLPHERKQEEGEERQVTFRKLNDLAAMFKPNLSTTEGDSNRNSGESEEKANFRHRPSKMENSASERNAPEGKAQYHDSRSPKTAEIAQPDDSAPGNWPPFVSRETANGEFIEAGTEIDGRSKSLKTNAVNPNQPESPELAGQQGSNSGDWNQLQADWRQVAAPKTTVPNAGVGRLPSRAMEVDGTELPSKMESKAPSGHVQFAQQKGSPDAETGPPRALKPVAIKKEIAVRQVRKFENPEKERPQPQVEIEDVMDQIVEQLQRDFKRYYGG